MKMTPEEKLALDIRDFWRICDGIAAYSGLDAKQAMERFRQHKEDAFCEVTDYSGGGKLMCTRDASQAVLDLAERHRESLLVPDDYSVKELADAIQTRIVRAMVEEKQDEPALARVLSEAEADANTNHLERGYHFPCVVVRSDNPPQFRIGPVLFTSAKAFPNAFTSEIQEYIVSSNDKQHAQERLRKFEEYSAKLGWVATVRVPPCAEECAKRRAELAVTTAINVLRLVFGIGHGRDMRLAHTAHTKPLYTEYAQTISGELDFILSWGGTGALAPDDWHLQLSRPEWHGFWHQVGHVVSTSLAGRRSEIASRVIDALTWFGEAAFEFSPGTQIVKFVAALERLTTTESFSTHRFCSRVALLSYEDDDSFEKCYWDAYQLHQARSAAIHGAFSPSSAMFWKTLRIAHDVTQRALFRAFEIHCYLDDRGELSTRHDLQNFFTMQHSKKADVLVRLKKALKEREDQERRTRC